MASVSYTAGLAYYSGSWNTDETAQGCYGNYRRTGVINFAGMNLKGKIINSVSLSVTSKSAGYNASKTAFFYRSSVQKLDTSLTGTAHRSGSTIGSVSGTFYNNTVTVTANFLKNAIANGENTFCIYATDSLVSGWSANYLKWSKVVLTVDYSEPEETPVSPTAPTQITPAYGTVSYYYSKNPTIAWSGASGGTKYIVERAVGTDIHLDTWSIITETTAQSFTDSSLVQELGEYVRYRVKNVSDTESSGYICTGNIRRMLPDTPPTDFVLDAEQNFVRLAWDAPAESFLRFRIEYSINGGEFTLLTTTAGFTALHDITQLPVGCRIIYRIRAEQTSVDSSDVIASAYVLSEPINKAGGIYIKKDFVWKRGVIWHKHGTSVSSARKTLIKIDNVWRESV